MASSLIELNALLDNFIPLTEKISIAKDQAKQKEAEALEKILARVWMVMPYLHENGEPGQCPLINREERIPIGQDGGLSVRNSLTLLEDGPRLVRSFAVEKWGTDAPAFQITDSQNVSCLDAIKTYGFEDICAGLVEMLKCQASIDVEYKELQSRIEKADSLIEDLQKKYKIECHDGGLVNEIEEVSTTSA
jgi:hypothetical protein